MVDINDFKYEKLKCGMCDADLNKSHSLPVLWKDEKIGVQCPVCWEFNVIIPRGNIVRDIINHIRSYMSLGVIDKPW